ncbi:T9SS type B sorting domain-containing protein [Flavobacterium pedocola]
MKKALAFLFIFVFCNLSYSQLADFTLQLNVTHETCSGNGALGFVVSNTTPGATLVYSVYRLPDVTTPITVTSANSLTGLVSGSYRVIATQSLGAESNSQLRDAVINNFVAPLQYNLSSRNVLCGNDGGITVNVTHGNAVSYEIISGPMTFPMQVSNQFAGLTTGTYQVRVYDSCGDAIVRDVTITRPSIPNLIINGYLPHDFTCTTLDVIIGIASGTMDFQNIIAYPLQVETTVFPPSGPPVVNNQVINSGNLINEQLTVPIAFFPDQPYSFNLKITDACGNVYQLNNNPIAIELDMEIHEAILACGKKMIVNPLNYVAPFTVTFVSAPAGFNPATFSSIHPGPYTEPAEYGNTLVAYPEGDYVIQITDACGRTITKSFTTAILPLEFTIQEYYEDCVKKLSVETAAPVPFTVEFLSAPAGFVPLVFNPSHPGPFSSQAEYFNLSIPYPEGTYVIRITDECGRVAEETYTTIPLSQTLNIFNSPGCEAGFGSILLRTPEHFLNVYIDAAPPGFASALPLNVSQNITADDQFFSMNSLPAGTYTFRYVDTCNRSWNQTVTVTGYQVNTSVVNVTEHCSSFDLQLNFSSNSSGGTFWLQKYFPLTNSWGNPQTGVSGGPTGSLNAMWLNNNTNNVNFYYFGRFRVVSVFSVFSNGDTPDGFCEKVLYEFEFTNGPRIGNVYGYACANSLSDVIVEAFGVAPLQYRVTTRNGLPFALNNGNSPLFTGLTTGVYNFQVEDACGNILNRIYDVSTPASFSISPNNLCDGQTGSLSVPYFSFLNYQWWKDTNTGTILSTTNVLTFPNFASASDFGTYHVRITNPGNPTSCMNLVLDYTVSNDLQTPNAGTGNNVILCGAQTTLNLFDYLIGSYDTNGEWSEVSSSGMLTGNIWNAANLPFGTYTFKYRVDGLCAAFDESIVQLDLRPIPQQPVASGDAITCQGGTLHLFASDIPGVTYQWTGPNGFVSSDQNPVIDNVSIANQGTYTVSVLQNGCTSESASITVTVEVLPSFVVKNDCQGNQTYLTASPENDLASFDYFWTLPDGTIIQNTNPINITGSAVGSYAFTITSPNGCTVVSPVEVFCTQCGIPKGVSPNNDGANDTFDLSCLTGITKVTIFNRYGVSVYEKDNYSDEWDGKDFKGRLLPTATYYYVVKFDTGDVRTGWVYLNY